MVDEVGRYESVAPLRGRRLLKCTRFLHKCTCCRVLVGCKPIVVVKSRPLSAGTSTRCCSHTHTACSRSIRCVYSRLRVTTGCVSSSMPVLGFNHPSGKTTCTVVTHVHLRTTDPTFGKNTTTCHCFKS